MPGDVANLDYLDALCTAVEYESGGLDIVVASARFVERGLTLNATPGHFDKTFGIGPRALRNLREVRAMQQQTAYSSWITVPVG